MAVISLLVVWAVYLFTLAPTVYVGDSGELTAAACLMGVPHPPGYPLFMWWGYLGSLLPLGNMAYRVNLATAASGLLVAVSAGAVLRKWFRHAGWSALGVGVIGLNVLLWSQSTAAEVYAVAGAALALVWWFGERDSESTAAHGWMGMSLACGLALMGHPMAIGALPVLAWKLLGTSRPSLGVKIWLGCALVGLGVTGFLSLPIRALAHPAVAWGETETFRGWLAHVMREQYGLSGASRTARVWWDQYRFLGSLVVSHWSWLAGVAALGWWVYGRKMQSWMLVSACVWVGLPLILNFQFDALSRDLVSMFLYPLIVPVGLGVVAGLHWCWARHKVAGGALIVVVMVWVTVQTGKGWAHQDRSQSRVAYDYGREVLQTVPAGGVAFLEGDNVLFPVAYVSYVEGWKSAGRVFDETGNVLDPIYGPGFMRLPADQHGRRLAEIQEGFIGSSSAVYFNVGTRLANRHDRPIGSEGLLLRWGQADSMGHWRRARVPLGVASSDADYMARDLTSLGWYYLGEAWLTRQDRKARQAHEIASRWAPENDTVHTNIGNAWLRRGRPAEAGDWYRRATFANPGSASNFYNWGYALAQQGLRDEALAAYQEALRVDDRHVASWMGAGMMWLQRQPADPERAVHAFRKAVELDPMNPQAYYNLGASLGNLGRYAEAREAFERALAIDPGYERARQGLEQLRR